MINAFWEPVQFHIQERKNWKRVVDTSRQDIVEERVSSVDYEVAPRSVVVLEAKTTESTPP
jgi:pullulanase/glycogen debranching enzyme